MAELSVGQVAQRCGVSVSALHFYERKGLIFSNRNQGNQRRYDKSVMRRVSVIKAAQNLGVSLAEIQQAFSQLPKFSAPTKAQWSVLSETWHQGLTQRINQLTALRDSLDGCIGCGCLSLASCPIYNPEDVCAEQGSGPIILNHKTENLGSED